MSAHPKYEVVIHMPTDVPNMLVKFGSVRTKVNANPYYATPSPTILIFDGHIRVASETEAGTKTNPPTFTIAQRDTAVNNGLMDVESYRIACQGLVNDTANSAIVNEIAESFDMELKTVTAHGVRQDSIFDGPLPLTATYQMKGAGPHQVQKSYDDGATHEDLNPTSKGETIVSGLVIKKDIWLRNRQVLTKDRFSDWTPWLHFIPTK